MKAIGFYSKYDSTFIYSKSKDDYFLKEVDQHLYNKDKVLSFLSKGKCCFGWMSYWEDTEDNLFLPSAYMSYGNWMWPDYFRVFIENNSNININEEFLKYIDNAFINDLEYFLDEAQKFYIDNLKK